MLEVILLRLLVDVCCRIPYDLLARPKEPPQNPSLCHPEAALCPQRGRICRWLRARWVWDQMLGEMEAMATRHGMASPWDTNTCSQPDRKDVLSYSPKAITALLPSD